MAASSMTAMARSRGASCSPRTTRPSIPSVRRSEAQRLRPDDVGNGADLVDHRIAQRLVDLDERDGVRARPGAAEMERRDIDAVLAQGAAEIADEARLVLIADEQHRGAELGLHGDALDLHEARLVAAEQRAGDDMLLPVADDDEPDQRLIVG